MLLAVDKDEESRISAIHTLESWPPEELQQVLSNPSTPVAVLDFAAYNLVSGRKQLGDALLRNPSLPGQLREWLENITALLVEAESSESSEAPVPIQSADEDGDRSLEEGPKKRSTVLQTIRRMTAVQKVKTALTGSQEERLILVRDSNKLVARAVMQSPKLFDHEVENFASMKDICEEALRIIALNRKFVKVYAVVRALVNTPRTPIDVGLQLLPQMHDHDLKGLVLNRNVSDVIRHAAERIIERKEKAANPKLPGKH